MVQKNRETQLVVRCSQELRDEAEALARRDGQSLAEWMRRAVQEKVDREKSSDAEYVSADELDARIEAVLKKMLAEAKE